MIDLFIWHEYATNPPAYGQVVELMYVVPAIYRGHNENGTPEWDPFYECGKTLFWRMPAPESVQWVKYFMKERERQYNLDQKKDDK